MGLSKNIKIAMIDKNIKQKELAQLIDKDLQQLYNALHRDTFTTRTADQIATALNCNIVLQDKTTGKIY